MSWKISRYFALVAGALFASHTLAYTVWINGVQFEATSKPSVVVEGEGVSGISVTVTNIDFGEATATVTTTSSNTSSTTSTGTTTSTSTNTGTTTSTSTNTSGTSCTDSARVLCYDLDLGPGKIKGWQGSAVIEAGRILAVPFSHADARTGAQQYGDVAFVGKTGASQGGYGMYAWFSAEPGGKPLDGSRGCGREVGSDDVIFWNQNKDFAGYCRLPDRAGKVFLNFGLCTSTDRSGSCSGQDTKFSDSDYKFIIAPTVRSY